MINDLNEIAMKKNYIFSAIALCACILSACNKEMDAPQTEGSEEKNEGVITYIRATGNENESKGSIDGTSGNFYWNEGDQIAVWNNGAYQSSIALSAEAGDIVGEKPANATFRFSGELNNRANFAVFPASIADEDHATSSDFSISLKGTYTLAEVAGEKSPVPMIAVNDGSDLHFKQLGALLRITLNNLPPSTRSVTIDFNGKKVQGEFTLTGVTPGETAIATSPIDEEENPMEDIITINIPAHEEEWLDNQVVNIPVPTGTYTKVTVTSYTGANHTGDATLTMTMPIKPGLNTTWKPIRTSARKMTASLPAFSVSNSKRVHIAKSNLQFTRESTSNPWSMTGEHKGTWSFLPESWSLQTGTIIDGKRYISYDHEYETQITLFAWGCSGYYDDEKTNTYFEPWRTVYKTDVTVEGVTQEVERAGKEFGTSTAINLTADSGYALGDWGVYACTNQGPLDDGSGYGSFDTWRLPTADEYMYLLGHTQNDVVTSTPYTITRYDDESNVKRYFKWGKGLINIDTESVQGFIIVPDYFVDPTGVFNEGYYKDYSDNKNKFTADQWTMMAKAGAAFFPYAENLSASATEKANARVKISNGVISYWSSTSYSANTHAKAFRLESTPDHNTISPASNLSRRVGSAVRLVRDLN